jgi:hypothetical protein
MPPQASAALQWAALPEALLAAHQQYASAAGRAAGPGGAQPQARCSDQPPGWQQWPQQQLHASGRLQFVLAAHNRRLSVAAAPFAWLGGGSRRATTTTNELLLLSRYTDAFVSGSDGGSSGSSSGPASSSGLESDSELSAGDYSSDLYLDE